MRTEDRLRQAFAALASTVDTEGPVPVRPRRRLMPAFAAAAAVVVVTGGVLFAVTQPAPGVPGTTAVAPVAPAAQAFPFDLYTHCGVDEAKIGDVYFEAESPLVGSARSAPAGWDNPYQRGMMTLVSPATAVFRDGRGHEVWFRARSGATAFKHLCD